MSGGSVSQGTACYVLPEWPTTCMLGTKGCDACEICTCHGCYSHAECECDEEGP